MDKLIKWLENSFAPKLQKITNLTWIVVIKDSMMQLLPCMTMNPAKLYRLDAGYLAENGPADLVLFDPAKEWVPERFYSKSQNSPFLGQKLKGKVEYTICKGKVIFEA